MDIALFVRGIVIGLVLAAPVGAIGLLCIRRTLAEGRVPGFVTGLGAATADAGYGTVAAAGLGSVSSLLIGHQGAIRVLGGLALVWLGGRIAFSPPARETAARSARGLLGIYVSTVVLTLANPATILTFVAIFAGLGLEENRGALVLVPGVFLGSALWWLVLTGAVGLVRGRITSTGLRWINRASGTALAGFGIVALVQGVG